MSKRTVLRHLDALRDDFGAPLKVDPSSHAYYLEGDFEIPLPELTEGEIVSLFLIETLLGQLEGTPYARPLASAGRKLRGMLTDRATGGNGAGADFISIPCDPLRGDELKLAACFGAMEQGRRERRTVAFDHFSVARNATSRRKLNPYHLFLRSGAWYVVGFCHQRREPRMYALDRIEGIELTEEPFTIPESFRIEEFLENSWSLDRGEPVTVRIRFDSYQARWIRERIWHPSQTITEEPDGGLIYTAEVAGNREIKQWALSFGVHAEVLEPEELRKEIGDEIRRLAGAYGEGGGLTGAKNVNPNGFCGHRKWLVK